MKYSRGIKVWLLLGLICVTIQVIVGGITRLTESGLSITEWLPVSGAMPPMTDEGWIEEFEKYKLTPQYAEINEGMEMDDFKFIYFWEFIHRQWARVMGLIFLFPFLYFYFTKQIDKTLLKKLGMVILLAVLAASFGWIMVASGLIERPWVNAYKLSMHLCIAFSVFVALLYAYMHTIRDRITIQGRFRRQRLLLSFVILLWIQLFLGGIMSGMRIGVVYPTWPDMLGEIIPQVLFNTDLYNVNNFNYYDQNELVPALVHFLHRSTAYIVFMLGCFLAMSMWKSSVPLWKNLSLALVGILVCQVAIGIGTVINCIGEIPVSWGVAHQGGALALLCVTYLSYYSLKHSNEYNE